MIFIIGVFILLFISMFLVLKFCKKKLKIFLSLIIISIILYSVMLSIEVNRVISLKTPVFAKETTSDIVDKITYKGLGYNIELKYGPSSMRSTDIRIINATMNMFNKPIIILNAMTNFTKQK